MQKHLPASFLLSYAVTHPTQISARAQVLAQGAVFTGETAPTRTSNHQRAIWRVLTGPGNTLPQWKTQQTLAVHYPDSSNWRQPGSNKALFALYWSFTSFWGWIPGVSPSPWSQEDILLFEYLFTLQVPTGRNSVYTPKIELAVVIIAISMGKTLFCLQDPFSFIYVLSVESRR